jgi:membrane protease YdiL (CAAX protease family)
MPTVLVAASIVPVLEELFFRGFILGVLLRSFSRLGALVLTSGLFSIVHFLKSPDQTTPNDAVRWFSGFDSIAHSFGQFGDPMLLAAGFLTLFALGCILADARLQTSSLWLPIGLHAGWIFANGTFSKAAHRETLALPWLGKDLLVGIVPLILALASWALMRLWVKHADARAPQPLPRTR